MHLFNFAFDFKFVTSTALFNMFIHMGYPAFKFVTGTAAFNMFIVGYHAFSIIVTCCIEKGETLQQCDVSVCLSFMHSVII